MLPTADFGIGELSKVCEFEISQFCGSHAIENILVHELRKFVLHFYVVESTHEFTIELDS